MSHSETPQIFERRAFIKQAGLTGSLTLFPQARGKDRLPAIKPTTFQITCMTLPYSSFSLKQAMEGIKEIDYEYRDKGPPRMAKAICVAQGVRHLSCHLMS
jgi:hypothetical protein